ncbi:MAG: hypothetical protein MI806_29840 [Minwuiales bacterium]|nr:hypothetical protein [Minwuiales bacterium]
MEVNKERIYSEVDDFVRNNELVVIAKEIDKLGYMKDEYERRLRRNVGFFGFLFGERNIMNEREYEIVCFKIGRMINQYNDKAHGKS